MDDRRWISGDGSRETDNSQSPSLYEDIEVMRSYTLLEITSISRYEITIGRRYADIRFTGSMAPRPSSNAKYDPESDPESQLQCRYRTSRTRLIFGGATIFKEGDDSAGFATTLTAKNYRTGSAGTKYCEMHSPIEKASSGKCTRRRSNNCTPRTTKSARRDVMANASTDES
jgi:hypothetical protein